MKRATIVALTSVVATLSGVQALAYEVPTHAAITQKAVESSGLQEFLESIGEDGNTFNGFDPVELIIAGSEFEDGISTLSAERVRHHFHDPLRSWSDAGLSAPPEVGHSSVIWGQQREEQVTIAKNDFTWQIARQRLFEGLTEGDPSTREERLALMLLTVGHVVHLVQDASVPAHTRNDWHLPGDPDGMHWFPRQLETEEFPVFNDMLSAGTALSVAGGLLSQAGGADAPIPIANLIDSISAAGGPTAPPTGLNVGIGEYSNANFVTEDTVFRNYDFPSEGAIQPLLPPQGDRQYYIKDQEGETVQHFVAEATWYEKLLAFAPNNVGSIGYTLDETVLRDYSSFLLPRAVAYSISLLDYFLRGSLHVAASNLDTTGAAIVVTNASQETLQGGTLQIWFDQGQSGVRTQLGSVPTGTLPPNGQLVIDENSGVDLQRLYYEGPTDGDIVFVYRGRLGAEDEAVLGRACGCRGGFDVAGDEGCEGLCPCRYVALSTGDPGEPGDGITTPPADANGNSRHSFPFPECLHPEDREGDITVTVFPGDTIGVGDFICVERSSPEGTACDKCGQPSGNASCPDIAGTTSVNGVQGYFVNVPEDFPAGGTCGLGGPPIDLLSGLGVGFTNETGCGFRCNWFPGSLDAVAICGGVDAAPSDP